MSFQCTWVLTPHARPRGCPPQSALGCPIAAPLHIPSLPLLVLKPHARCRMDTLCCPLELWNFTPDHSAAPVWTPSLSQPQYLKLDNHYFSTEAVFKENHAKANFLGCAVIKNPPANAGDPRVMNLIPGLGRSFEVRNGNLLQYSCLENSMDRGAW